MLVEKLFVLVLLLIQLVLEIVVHPGQNVLLTGHPFQSFLQLLDLVLDIVQTLVGQLVQFPSPLLQPGQLVLGLPLFLQVSLQLINLILKTFHQLSMALFQLRIDLQLFLQQLFLDLQFRLRRSFGLVEQFLDFLDKRGTFCFSSRSCL